MRMNNVVSLFLAVAVLGGGDTISAHHGTRASYDMDNTITVSGTVTEFRLAYPHSQLYFDVIDEEGRVVHWAGEMNSPRILQRVGWTKDTMRAGDEITLSLHPSLAGTPVGVVERGEPMIVNGKVLVGTGPD